MKSDREEIFFRIHCMYRAIREQVSQSELQDGAVLLFSSVFL